MIALPSRFLRSSVGVLFLASVAVLSAQSVVTDPVGFDAVQLPGGSDTYLTIPFTKAPTYVGLVGSVSGSTVTISGSPNFTAGQFAYTTPTQAKFYLLISTNPTSNPKEGREYTISNNDGSSVTVDLNGDDLSTLAAGTQIYIISYWTLATAFPPADAGISYIVSPSAFVRKTQILFPNLTAQGINNSYSNTYYYFNNAWRLVGAPTTVDYGADTIFPNTHMIVRNPVGSTTTFTAIGSVLTKKFTAPLATRVAGQQDNYVSLLRPIDVSLDNLGLISSGAFLSSPSAFVITDRLFVFDNTSTSINKSASTTYYYSNSHWRKVGASSSTDFGSDLIPATAGFVIRKAATADGATKFWTNAPTY